MIFEIGLLLSSGLYLLICLSCWAVPFWTYRLFFGTLCIDIIDSVIFPNITPSVFVNMILTFHCFLTLSFRN